MEETEKVDTWVEIALALFPPDQWSLLLLITLATFGATQMLKVVVKSRVASNELGSLALRVFAASVAFLIAWGLWPVKQWGAVLAIGCIGWLLAHLLSEYGMRVFATVAPNLYRRFNAEPNRRRENRGPKKGKSERRKP